MTYIEQAIKEAVEQGGYLPFVQNWNTTPNRKLWMHYFLLDPLFWAALGKAKNGKIGDLKIRNGFGETIGREQSDRWKETWHRFIDNLAQGKDAESFFAELLTK
jgi:hypothetical protein